MQYNLKMEFPEVMLIIAIICRFLTFFFKLESCFAKVHGRPTIS